MFFEELCSLGLIAAASVVFSLICLVAIVVIIEKLKAERKDRCRIAYENAILRDRIRRIEALNNIAAANEFNAQLDREGGNK